MKVVLDTNILVSRAISPYGAPAAIITQWLQGSFELLVSPAILAEYAQTLADPRILKRSRVEAADIHALIEDITRVATPVAPEQPISGVSSDPGDDMFLECAAAGGADYIVSGDQHLLVLGTFRNIPIVPPAAFVMVLGEMSET